MRTTFVPIVVTLGMLACEPSQEAPGAAPDVRAPEVSAPEGAPAPAQGTTPATPSAPGMAQTVEWDQRLLDLLLVQMQITERLSAIVASRAADSGLRAYAEEERDAARHARDELQAFRTRWYPDAPPVSIATAPTLTELGPTSRDQASRQGPAALDRSGGQDPRTTEPARGRLSEGGEPEGGKPPIVARGSGTRLPEGREIDVGRPGELDPADLPAATGSQDEQRLLTGVEDQVRLLETGPVDVRTATAALAPMHQRALAAATIGGRGAAHPELRELAERIRLQEERALERLRKLGAGDRG